jgi:hypothetical protein
MKNSIFAIPAATDAMPENPNKPATIAIIKKKIAHLNIIFTPLNESVF